MVATLKQSGKQIHLLLLAMGKAHPPELLGYGEPPLDCGEQLMRNDLQVGCGSHDPF